MKQFVLDFLIAEMNKVEGVRASIPQGHEAADLQFQLKNGRQVVIYVINRALRLPEIREKYERNSSRRHHSLFIVDGRLLPAHGVQADAPYWVQALHALNDGRLYAYRCERRDVSILPVHIDWRWGADLRTFTYGPPVLVSSLRTDVYEVNSKYITGRYATAGFGDAPFWQKRPPVDEVRGNKHSWRNFSYRSEKKRTPPPQEEEWDSWEEFQRNYGEVPGGNFRYAWEEPFPGDQQRAAKRRSTMAQHYDLLGVPHTATMEEVKQAFRAKAREYHPDLHPHRKQEYTAKMIEINAAYEAIKKLLEK